METDVLGFAHVRPPGLHHWHDAHVPPEVVDGVDGVEAVHGDISWRRGMFGFDDTRPALAS